MTEPACVAFSEGPVAAGWLPASIEVMDLADADTAGGTACGNPARAVNLALLGSPGVRAVFLLNGPGSLPAQSLEQGPTAAVGLEGALGSGTRAVARLLAAAGELAAVAVDRSVFVDIGGFDERLGAVTADLRAPTVDLMLRLLAASAPLVTMPADRARLEHARGDVGVGIGRLLRRGLQRTSYPRTGAAAAVASVTAQTLLKRAGRARRTTMTGHDVVGIVAGATERRWRPVAPLLQTIPTAVRAVLEEHQAHRLRPAADARPGDRLTSYIAQDEDGVDVLAVHVYEGAPPGLIARLEERERWRTVAAPGSAWAPRLLAVAERDRSVFAAESLHVAAGRFDVLTRYVEAAHWLDSVRGVEAELPVAPTAHGAALAEEAYRVGDPRAAAAADAVAELAAVPVHGDLRPERVVITPGGVVLTGWQEWERAGIPGFDAVTLACATLEQRGQRSVIEALPARLEACNAPGVLVPLLRDAERCGDTATPAQLLLAAVLLLARRERLARERLETVDTGLFGRLLHRWLER
jgi:hypothetical protein